MEGPRSCKKEELKEVIALIDGTFRIPRGYAPTMGKEFPLLLGEKNLDNIRIILEHGKPVADVNYYKTKVFIEGVSINVASIGAVCSHEKVRGKGYASLILDDVESRLVKDDVHLMLVSGSRNLYLRRECCVTGKCCEYTINFLGKSFKKIELIDINSENLYEMVKLYNEQNTRFYRSYEEFEYLFKGATTPWANLSYNNYLIKYDQKVRGYIVLRTYSDAKGDNFGYVVECSGDENALWKAMQNIIEKLNLQLINMPISHSNPMVKSIIFNNIPKKNMNLLGTVKIMNFSSLIKTLKPYFSQYVEDKSLEALQCHEDESKFIFKLYEETLEITSQQELADLIFGNWEKADLLKNCPPKLKAFFNKVFPIPFPWPGNMNFQ